MTEMEVDPLSFNFSWLHMSAESIYMFGDILILLLSVISFKMHISLFRRDESSLQMLLYARQDKTADPVWN